jgi:hypothetical protein
LHFLGGVVGSVAWKPGLINHCQSIAVKAASAKKIARMDLVIGELHPL